MDDILDERRFFFHLPFRASICTSMCTHFYFVITSCVSLLLTRATASMFLEKQAQNVDGMVSGFEQQLAKDGNILDQPNALPSRNQQLQVLYCIMQPELSKNSQLQILLCFLFNLSVLSPYAK